MRQRHIYAAIREAHEETGYPIELACELLHVARSAYHRWASGKLSRRAAENEHLADTQPPYPAHTHCDTKFVQSLSAT